MRTQDYYDDFAGWYERERGQGYHQLIDDLEVDLVERYGRGAAVLEAGCGTGLLLDRVRGFAAEAWGFDLSAGMLQRARERGLHVVQAGVTSVPFPDARFDLVYSFKVLAHVEAIGQAVAELARVTRPRGHMLLEFYNPLSLRYLVKRLKPAQAISASTTDTAVYTRYDGLAAARAYLPAGCRVVALRGVRVATPVAAAHRVPFLGAALRRLEWALADAPLLSRLGGFLILVVEKS